MTEEVVQHGPHLKVNIRKLLMEVVYGPPLFNLQERLDKLIMENQRATGRGDWCVSFRGRTWVYSLCKNERLPLLVPRVAKSVMPFMAAWLADQLEIEEEQLLSGGALTAVLNVVRNTDDYFRVFPECMHDTLRGLLATLPEPDPSIPPLPTLSDEQMAALQSRQGQYLVLLQQRMLRTLISA